MYGSLKYRVVILEFSFVLVVIVVSGVSVSSLRLLLCLLSRYRFTVLLIK